MKKLKKDSQVIEAIRVGFANPKVKFGAFLLHTDTQSWRFPCGTQFNCMGAVVAATAITRKQKERLFTEDIICDIRHCKTCVCPQDFMSKNLAKRWMVIFASSEKEQSLRYAEGFLSKKNMIALKNALEDK